jgi:hypothetical protein
MKTRLSEERREMGESWKERGKGKKVMGRRREGRK